MRNFNPGRVQPGLKVCTIDKRGERIGPGHTETSHFGLVIAGAQLACVIPVTRSHQTLSAKLEWLVFLTRQILNISKHTNNMFARNWRAETFAI